MTIGGLSGFIGLLFLGWAYIKVEKKLFRSWKSDLLPCLLTYFALQLAASVLMGLLGILLHHIANVPYETTKDVLYYFTDVLQNLVRMGFLFFVMMQLKKLDWKQETPVLWKGLWIAMISSVISIGLRYVPLHGSEAWIWAVWDVFYLLMLTIYFAPRAPKWYVRGERNTASTGLAILMDIQKRDEEME